MKHQKSESRLQRLESKNPHLADGKLKLGHIKGPGDTL